jgi:hypothetical protein
VRGEWDRKTPKMLAVRAEKRSFLLPTVVCSTPCWCADHVHHRFYFLFSLLCLSACSRGRFQTCPRSRSCACRCLLDAIHTLRAGPYSRVLDASAVSSRCNLYTAGQPILPRARRQRGAFQTQPIHCGPEARAPRCEREGWFPNLISPPSSSTGEKNETPQRTGITDTDPVCRSTPFPPRLQRVSEG